MQAESIVECSNRAQQYIQPALSYHLSKSFILSSLEWLLKTGLTVFAIFNK